MKIYYAHCKAIYGTQQEIDDLNTLNALGFEVVNPNDAIHKEGWAIKRMPYADELIDGCDALVFRRVAGGRYSAGVAYEINYAATRGLPIIELPSIHLNSSTVMSVEETKTYTEACLRLNEWWGLQ